MIRRYFNRLFAEQPNLVEQEEQSVKQVTQRIAQLINNLFQLLINKVQSLVHACQFSLELVANPFTINEITLAQIRNLQFNCCLFYTNIINQALNFFNINH